MIDNIDQDSRIRRMLRHMVKAMHYFSELSMITEVRAPESEFLSAPELSPEPELGPAGVDLISEKGLICLFFFLFK